MLHEGAEDVKYPKAAAWGLLLLCQGSVLTLKTLPGSISRFGIYVMNKGGVVWDAEKLRLATLYVIYGWVYVGMKC